MDKLTKALKSNLVAFGLLLVGSISWSLTMIKSGWLYEYGMGFWGPNGHDGVWHIAVIESLSRGSWNMPVYAGHILQNYHLGYDLLVAILHKFTFIQVVNLYFQVLPVILAWGVGVACYRFVYAWKQSKQAALWSTFFVYFGSGWGWLVSLIRDGQLGGESMFWSQQSISTLINPPYALSLLMIFVGLELLVRTRLQNDHVSEIISNIIKLLPNNSQKNKVHSSKTSLVVISFIFGLLIFVKVYAGLLIVGGLFIVGTYQLLIKREGIRMFQVFISVLTIALLFFLPMSSDTGSVIVWKPFWFLETMMHLSDRLNWPHFGEALINYRLGNIWWKAIPAYIVAFFIFWYGNAGTRIVGEVYIAKRLLSKTIDYIDLLLLSMIVAGVLIPTLFVQSGTPWNTIQFLYYSLTFSGVFAGIAVSEVNRTVRTRSLILQWTVGVVIVLLTLPTSYSTLVNHYLPSRPPAKISHEELEALRFLARLPEGVVLTYPYDSEAAHDSIPNPPRPLYLYESTAYVAAFGKHDVYLEDEVNLNITGYDWPRRRENIEEMLTTNDSSVARRVLLENNIRYVYWVDGQRATLGEDQLGLKRLFENDRVDIYEVMHTK